jgi:hypothetical protein
MLPIGYSVNKKVFAGAALSIIICDRALSRPKLKASGTFLHFDNARPQVTSDRYDKFGIKGQPHPPCSPDLVSCDFWLFGYLKHYLEGWCSHDDIALEGLVSATLISIEAGMFVRVFAEWGHRLQQCVDQGSDYLSTSRLVWPFMKLSGTRPQANRLGHSL